MSKKCSCKPKKLATCPVCSKVKMVMMLKHNNNDLKYFNSNGRACNPVWYSHFSKNNKPLNKIIDGMINRFNKSKYVGKVNKLMFYDNETKDFIKSESL